MSFRSWLSSIAAQLRDLWGHVTGAPPRARGRNRGTYDGELTPDQVAWLRERAEERREIWRQHELKGQEELLRLKSGFSDPAFASGGMSEFDRAVEIGAKALYEFDPQLNVGKPIAWNDLNEHVRERKRKQACVVLRSVNSL